MSLVFLLFSSSLSLSSLFFSSSLSLSSFLDLYLSLVCLPLLYSFLFFSSSLSCLSFSSSLSISLLSAQASASESADRSTSASASADRSTSASASPRLPRPRLEHLAPPPLPLTSPPLTWISLICFCRSLSWSIYSSKFRLGSELPCHKR